MFLEREDLVAQAISVAALLTTRRPFGGDREITALPRLHEVTEPAMRDIVRYLASQNAHWREFLAERPPGAVARLTTEAFAADPGAALDAVGRRLGLPLTRPQDGVAAAPGIDEGPYETDRELKQALRLRFGTLLERLVAEASPAGAVKGATGGPPLT